MDLLWQKPLQGQKDTCLKREQIFWRPNETDSMRTAQWLYTQQFDKWQQNSKSSGELHEKQQWFYMNCGNYNLVNSFQGFFLFFLFLFFTPQRTYAVKTSCGVLALSEMCCLRFLFLLQMHCLPRVSKLVGDMTKILVSWQWLVLLGVLDAVGFEWQAMS